MTLAKLISSFKAFFRRIVLEPYFCFWSRLYLKRWRPLIIVITGSVAKTNLLYILKEQLGDRVAYSDRANTKVGITCSIFDLPSVTAGRRWQWLVLLLVIPFKALFAKVRSEDKYLVEYDIYDMFSARYFKWWLRPNICLWTTISPSHLGNFEKIARKKNIDVFDLIVGEFMKIVKSADQRIFALKGNNIMEESLGDSDIPVVWLEDKLIKYRISIKETVFEFEKNKFIFKQPLPQEISQILTLIQGLMNHFNLPLKTNLRDWQPPPGRSTLLKGYKGCYLIDSSYNAQLEAVLAILSMFQSLQTPTKWLVCGDMIEQGAFTRKAHLKLADKILELNPQRVFLVGRRTKKYVYPVLRGKHPHLHWTAKVDKVFLSYLKQRITGQEVILFKGAGFLDILIETLLENRDDRQFLNSPGRLYHILH